MKQSVLLLFGLLTLPCCESSKSSVIKTKFKELELNPGLRHGFLYHPMDEWMSPCKQWARREYHLTKMDVKVANRLRHLRRFRET